MCENHDLPDLPDFLKYPYFAVNGAHTRKYVSFRSTFTLGKWLGKGGAYKLLKTGIFLDVNNFWM